MLECVAPWHNMEIAYYWKLEIRYVNDNVSTALCMYTVMYSENVPEN